MTQRRKNLKKEAPKKQCSSCGKPRTHSAFYKVDSIMFPDGMINICSTCVREQVDVENEIQVIEFLRQIDKPFVKSYWNEAVQSGRYPLGEYIRKINSLQQFKGKSFEDSDGMSDGNSTGKTADIAIAHSPETVMNVKGEVIEYSDALVDKWGIGYKKHEYLKMEKFYQDMRLTHEIQTPIHVDLLTQLSYMSVERDRLRQSGDWQNYPKISDTIEKMTKSAGFRPVDRQGIDDATGIRSFAQIWEEVEKKGFRKPPTSVFEEDVVDAMIVSLLNYYHRLVGVHILKDVPDDVKQELDEFYEIDETPVEIDEEAYEDLDFSVNDEDDEDVEINDR